MSVGLWAQSPLSGDTPYISTAARALESEWRASAARVALKSGLSSTAVELYEALFKESGGLADELDEDYRLDLVAALVAQGRFSDAKAALGLLDSGVTSARRALYEAVVMFGNDRRAESESWSVVLSSLNEDQIYDFDLPWLHMLRGVLAESQGERSQARESYVLAEASAVSSLQRAFFSSLVLRQEMLSVPPDEGLLLKLKEQMNRFSGQPAAFPFLREYVVLLHRMDRDGEAIAALENELSNIGAGYSAAERADLLLLKGLILGSNSAAGWSALKELVRMGGGDRSTAIALQLLAAARGRDAELMSFLNETISRPDGHPLLAMLYYVRSQIALASPDTSAIAEADARYLLEQFPGLEEITNVYRLLAYAALQRSPPQYRVAADYLLSLRNENADSFSVAELNRLIGDCYFMNEDYGNAVDFYQASRNASADSRYFETVFLRLVIAEIRSGGIDAALDHVDEADFGGKFSIGDRWRAEWNIAQALQSDGRSELALERVRSLLSNQGEGAVPASLDLRLRWLEAYLSLSLGEEGVQELIRPMLARLDSLPENSLNSNLVSLLKPELLLLEIEALVRAGEVEQGIEFLTSMRAEFPESSAAERSYFVEAGYEAALGDFLSAQQTLVEFIARYPESEMAVDALFQAALYCERRGEESYPEAVLLLDRLVQEYPGSALVYRSSLKQGDLLRLMNDFAGAQLIYENLVNSYPGHELQYLSELSRADCIAALSQGDESQLLEAASILERLVDMPGLPAHSQVEAGYKWGTILRGRNESDAAREVFSLIAMRYMFDARNASDLEAVGRYWLSRTVFSLGEILEDEGDLDEAKRLYRKMVAFNLPGRNLALARVDRLHLRESR